MDKSHLNKEIGVRVRRRREVLGCTREQIAEKGNSLDLGLIRDDSIVDYEDLPDPIESGEEAIAQLEEAVDLLQSVVNELKSLQTMEV